jgi:rare lipoprotein A
MEQMRKLFGHILWYYFAMRRLAPLLFLIVSLSACSHGKARVSAPSSGKIARSELQGIASYYAEPYHGRKTASGEIFDTYNAMTAAHKTLPFDTVVRVRNMANGEEVDVRINDRGPFVKGRVIDLSLAAAKEIDLVRAGIAPVELKVLKKGSPVSKPSGSATASVGGNPSSPASVPESAPPASEASPQPVFGVQVGAFQSESAATRLRDELAMRYSDVSIQTIMTDQTLYRVRVGRVGDMKAAEELARKLQDEHLSTFVVRLN